MMQLWEFVLLADQRLSLDDLDEAKKLLSQVGACPPSDGKFTHWRDDLHGGQWREALRALRSVAARNKKRKWQASGMIAAQADHVVRAYLEKLRVSVLGGMDADKYRGVMPLPRSNKQAYGQVAAEYGPGIADIWDALDMFWQRTFGSLFIADAGTPYCGRCGKELDKTDRLRPSRAKFCSKCRPKEWASNQPRASLKKRWAENKRRQRERQRNLSKKKGK